MVWAKHIDAVRLQVLRRPVVFAVVAMLVTALALQIAIAPVRDRDEAMAAQTASTQALYNKVMANANALDQAAIELRRLSLRDNETPYERYFAALNDLRWTITPANTPFLDDAGRAQALVQVAGLGEAGEDYATAARELKSAYGQPNGSATFTAADAAEVSYRALRDRILTLKSQISTSHTAGLATRALAAKRASRNEDLLFNGLLVFCLGLLVFFIAARRRAVVLLNETRTGRSTLDAVVDSALNGVVMIDESGVIELFSPSAALIFDCGDASVIGSAFTRFLDPGVVHRHRALLSVSGRRRRAVAFSRVVEARRWNGAAFPMHLAISETSIDGRRKFVLIIRDISDEVSQSQRLETALEEAQAASRAKTEFLTVISHELRTPLNGVLGMASALSAGPLAIPQREMVQTILSSGHHLLGLLNDLLDLSAVETGEITLHPQVFDMATLLTDALGPHADQASQKGLALSVNVDPAALGSVFADPRRLRQIMGNLVSNAIKFTPRGEIVVYVERPSDSVLRFSVSDTGIGFDAAVKARLFAEFEQGDCSMTRRYGGSGLGLAISRHLVGLMEGEIGCDSRPGEGSRFWFEIKALAVAAPAPGAEEEDADIAATPAQSLRILCVDDNATNRKVIGVLLAPLGVDVSYAEDGAQAVEAHAKGDFDIILMDLQMPVMDGLDATRAIRAAERQSGRRRARIIAVSANCMPSQIEDCASAGMDAHVAKPVQTDLLYAAMSAPAAEALDASSVA